MTTARRKQICLDVTFVYHCIIRCVRRSYLCGYESQYTSVSRRLRHRETGLMKFKSSACGSAPFDMTALGHPPIEFREYLELLDYTGIQVKRGKRGSIDQNAPSIVLRLGYTAEKWMKTQTPQVSWKQKALGSAEKIKHYCHAIGQNWIWQIA